AGWAVAVNLAVNRRQPYLMRAGGGGWLARETSSAWDYQCSAWVRDAHRFADREAELTGYGTAGDLRMTANWVHQ
ncbi:MAG: hypothetical protein ACRDC7_10525, partial [Aeromonas veronii]